MIYLKLDFDKTGLDCFFKPYQIRTLELLEMKQPAITFDLWESQKDDVSRASVINFLAEMERRNLLRSFETTGKGGHRPNYTFADGDLKGLRKRLAEDFRRKAEELGK